MLRVFPRHPRAGASRARPALPRARGARRWWFVGLLALACLLGGCDEAADLIPGNGDDAAPAATPTTGDGDPNPLIAPGSLGASGGSAESGPRIPDEDLARSVVQVVTVQGEVPQRNGSGVVIDTERRLILTSAELVRPFLDDGSSAFTTIHVSTNRTPGAEPEAEFAAEIAQIDDSSGIAVLRVTGAAGGGALARGDFDLPAASVGDPLSVQRGESLRLFGHPGIGDTPRSQAVTVTAAQVTGFRGDRSAARRWIRTDARIPWGAAGGPAFNEHGSLVGILAQLAYAAGATVGHVRPVHHAAGLLEAARDRDPADLVAMLRHPGRAPGTDGAPGADGAVVSAPAFAENAVEAQGTRDLFDYATVFPTGIAELHYEFTAQGVPDGAPVQELWYLDGVLQDAVSSSYTWTFGSLATVSDRLASPAAQGIPDGRWRLEVWIDGTLRASSAVAVGAAPPTPSADNLRLSTVAGADQRPGGPAFAGSTRLLGFFDYRGAAQAETVRWIVFHEGRLVYQSPAVPWNGGDSGTTWVGYLEPGGIAAGTWEFEIYFDNRVAGSGAVAVF